MELYKLKNGAFVAPPRGGVSVKGRAISNFSGRVEFDTAFAAENGYYPIKESSAGKGELLEGEFIKEVNYTLKEGAWVCE